jgi:protein TonB
VQKVIANHAPEATMLNVLLESRATRPRRLGGTLMSMLVHGMVIAAIVALTLPGRSSARSGPDIVLDTIRFIRPTPPTPAASASPPLSRTPTEQAISRPDLPTIDVPTITPTTIPPIDLAAPPTSSDEVIIGRRSNAFDSGMGERETPLSGSGSVREASAVDRPPRILGRALEPRYPATLRSAGVAGHVLAEFVVDTLGRAELESLRFPELTNPLFGEAVREALRQYRFSPGEVAGRKVRTRVAVPFEFRVRA